MRTTFSVTAGLVAAAAVLFFAVPASAGDADEAALRDARRRVQQIARDLALAEKAEESAESSLREADIKVALLERAVNQAVAALESQQEAVATIRHRLVGLEADVARQERAFDDRAADLYKRGAGAPFAAVLGAGSIDDALGRSAYVQALSSSDQAALERLQATRVRTEADRRTLGVETARLEAMKREKEALLEEVREVRRHRAVEAAAATAEVEELRAGSAAAERESRRVAELIRERERRREAALRYDDSATNRRAEGTVSTTGYMWPRCDRVTSEYGRRWGRRHEGLDIDGNTGAPIYAAKAGTVIYAGWYSGYGRLTLLDHGDGVVTAYAHQSRIDVVDGARVTQGQRIGSVGTTGNSTGSHLHFETRVHGEPRNPRNFLPSGC
ncbi:MAG: murein hydrolase activator EnvC family protein [Nitriliruptorales bacterium]